MPSEKEVSPDVHLTALISLIFSKSPISKESPVGAARPTQAFSSLWRLGLC